LYSIATKEDKSSGNQKNDEARCTSIGGEAIIKGEKVSSVVYGEGMILLEKGMQPQNRKRRLNLN